MGKENMTFHQKKKEVKKERLDYIVLRIFKPNARKRNKTFYNSECIIY